DGKTVATAGTDQTIKLWDITTGKLVGTLIGNADRPFAIAFMGNNAVVMGAGLPTGDSGRIHFWRTNPANLTTSVVTGEVYAIVANPDGTKMAAWSARPSVGDDKNNSYQVFDAKGQPLTELLTDKGRNVRAATFTLDLAWAVSGDKQGTVRFWDLAKREPIGGDFAIHVNEIVDLGITPDKATLVAVDSQGLVKVANVADHKKREVIGSFTPHKGGTRTLLVSPTG